MEESSQPISKLGRKRRINCQGNGSSGDIKSKQGQSSQFHKILEMIDNPLFARLSPPPVIPTSLSVIANTAQTREINIDRIRVLSVFIEKNSKALKRSIHKGFCVFLLYKMLIVALKYGENKAKKAKICIFNSLKPLQHKGLSEILP
jgi:hypothetical protein